jgi:hypothetical protein
MSGVDVLDCDSPERLKFRVSRQVAVARGWQIRLLRALRNDELADCHPDAARWQRNAYMARARRIRNEFAQGAA